MIDFENLRQSIALWAEYQNHLPSPEAAKEELESKKADLQDFRKHIDTMLFEIEFHVRVCDLCIDPNNKAAAEFIGSPTAAYLIERGKRNIPQEYGEIIRMIEQGSGKILRPLSPEYYEKLARNKRKIIAIKGDKGNGQSRNI